MNEKKYNLTIDEIMELLIDDAEPKGFSKEEIHTAEKRLHISLPKQYQRYLQTYGKEDINQYHNQIFTPEEITTSYECIEETIAEMGFESMTKEQLEKYADNEYYKLYLLSKDEWHTITQNYVLIWCENQGVWNAGYLFSDLENGVENPPIYMTIDDDFITFTMGYENTEHFLMDMLDQALSDDILQEPEEIDDFFEQNKIDREKLQRKIRMDSQKDDFLYMGNCWDKDKQRLYFYHSFYNSDMHDTQVGIVYLE